LLRQHIRATDRLSTVIRADPGLVTAIIPDAAAVECGVRCATFNEVLALKERVVRCFEGSALATGCTFECLDKWVFLMEGRS
jgi:metal-dependent amidase/aminoacylase/carboxypeptidase family protein